MLWHLYNFVKFYRFITSNDNGLQGTGAFWSANCDGCAWLVRAVKQRLYDWYIHTHIYTYIYIFISIYMFLYDFIWFYAVVWCDPALVLSLHAPFLLGAPFVAAALWCGPGHGTLGDLATFTSFLALQGGWEHHAEVLQKGGGEMLFKPWTGEKSFIRRDSSRAFHAFSCSKTFIIHSEELNFKAKEGAWSGGLNHYEQRLRRSWANRGKAPQWVPKGIPFSLWWFYDVFGITSNSHNSDNNSNINDIDSRLGLLDKTHLESRRLRPALGWPPDDFRRWSQQGLQVTECSGSELAQPAKLVGTEWLVQTGYQRNHRFQRKKNIYDIITYDITYHITYDITYYMTYYTLCSIRHVIKFPWFVLSWLQARRKALRPWEPWAKHERDAWRLRWGGGGWGPGPLWALQLKPPLWRPQGRYTALRCVHLQWLKRFLFI